MLTAMAVRTCWTCAFPCPRQRQRMPCPWANSLTVPPLRSGPRNGPSTGVSAARCGRGAAGRGVRAGENPRCGRCRRWTCSGIGRGRGGTGSLGEPGHDQRGRGGRGGRVGAMPALADLPLGAGDLLAVVVDVEVVPGEGLVLTVLTGGVAPQRPGDGGLVCTGGLFQVGQGGVAGVDRVFGGQQSATRQACMDAGQDLAYVGGGRGGGHVHDHVGSVGSAGLGQVSGESLPADDCVAGRGVVGRDDRPGRGRQPGAALHLGGAPAQVSCGVMVVVLHHDLAQGLDTGTGGAVGSVPGEVFQEPDGIVSGGEDSGLGLGGVLAQPDRSTVAEPPVLIDQLVQQVWGRVGDFFECGTDRFGDQLQAGKVTHRGQDVGGVGALRGAFAHQSGLLEAGQREVEEPVGTAVFGEPVAEVGRHAVMETGIVQLHGHGVLEVDAAADRLGGLPARQAEQELQHTDGGQLSRRETRTPVPRVPVGESSSHHSPSSGPVPISPSCHPGCPPARPAQSEAGHAHRNGGGGTTGTSTSASIGGTTRACPLIMLSHRETPRSPTESS